MGLPWPKTFSKKPRLTCSVAQVFQYPESLSHRTCAEGVLVQDRRTLGVLCKHPPLRSIPSFSTATAHHPWHPHLDAEQQQEGGICPHRRQGLALFPHQEADGSTLREDQNSLPQSKSVLFFFFSDQTLFIVFFMNGSQMAREELAPGC